MVFLWYFYGISLGLLWDFLWGVNGISRGFLWGFKRMPMGFPLDSYGISMMFLYSMIFLEDFYGISEGMLWEFNGILMGFPLDPLGSYEISMVIL